ncbi:MAG: flavin reductase [Clostridia bacterium]|nr:flavin reductase [Clostridia bacterium]
MHCTRKITEDLVWLGANDRRLSLFEGVYEVPRGVSYNSYLLKDEKTVVFDTVDASVSGLFFENLEYELGGRKLDYIVVQHMEPDHSATLGELLRRYHDVTVVCSPLAAEMIGNYFGSSANIDFMKIAEGDTLNTGRHELTFLCARMVHWPEVMVSYDKTDKILFSADAFGTFGALDGAIFADEVDFDRDYMDEARRYYTNIVGKYGTQVQALLKKAAAVDIAYVCPLHGFVWRAKFNEFLDKYLLWSSYTPEEKGVMLAYSSVYGNTANAADILASELRLLGVKVRVFDVSVAPAADIIAASFRYSHLIFAATTYNAGIFVRMEEALRDLAEHNIQNRTVAFMQNGSWAPTSGKLMREILEPMKNITFIENTVDIRSSVHEAQREQIKALANAVYESMCNDEAAPAVQNESLIDNSAMFKLSYGLYILTVREGDKDNGCVINTAVQLTDNPKRLNIAVNKANYTEEMIKRTGAFNLSVLTETAPFKLFKHFGFQSGRDADKFENLEVPVSRSVNGVAYLGEFANAYISCKVIESRDYGTHTLFVADIVEAGVIDGGAPSVTYSYYFDHIKPKPAPIADKKGFVCKICGYVYEGDELPADFICPLCKHGAEDFEPLK